MAAGRARLRSILWALLALIATVVSASALPMALVDDTDEATTSVVVGDLKLADSDEGPKDGVKASLRAPNLAPGDEHSATIEVFREAIVDAYATENGAVKPVLDIAFREDRTWGPQLIAPRILIEEIQYGSKELTDELTDACGHPLNFERLIRCTHQRSHPLQGLADPTPSGKELYIHVRMDPSTGNEFQGASMAFTIRFSLRLDTVEPTIPDPEDREIELLETNANTPSCTLPAPSASLTLVGLQSVTPIPSNHPLPAEVGLIEGSIAELMDAHLETIC